nr:MBL fold metallo-hydrolase [Nakamurella flavida]
MTTISSLVTTLFLRRRPRTTLLVVASVWLIRACWGVLPAIGASRRRIARAAAGSPEFRDGAFRNTLPTAVMVPGSGPTLLKTMLTRGSVGRPNGDIPLARPDLDGPVGPLAVTWLGHASTLVELGGARILTDPVWQERVSPSQVVGPARLHPMPLALVELPQVDAIVISHDHYDHLELAAVRTLLRTQRAPFLVPTGIGEHLRGWGVPESRIHELGWNESVTIGEITYTCTESRHFSGRSLRRNTTLWASWVFASPQERVFFGGDTGYTPAFAGIGAQHGPFDLTILPIGAYGAQWPSIHMDPEEAVRAHGDLGGQLLLPIHWASFDLAAHSWAEPIERLQVAARSAASPVRIVAPRPGQRVVVAEPLPVEPWWAPLS